MDIFRHDRILRQQGFRIIAGVDEAGRGPLAGPVVAAAVILPDDVLINGLRDSKKVPEKERRRLFWDIVNASADIGVGIVDHQEIDAVNILQATKNAMHAALNDLSTLTDLVILDAVSLPFFQGKQLSFVRAESRSASVAAASIIAKHMRDSLMLRYHEQYPQYNFKKHKGYCTEEHRDMLRLHGPCPIHRKTFRQVMELDLPL